MITHRHQIQSGQTGRSIFIINPVAGSAESTSDLLELVSAVPNAIARQTSEAGDARDIARMAVERGFDRIVAVGGDGTINAVINGIAPDFDDVELGIVPVGTGNDLARSLGITNDPQQAFTVLRQRRLRALDIVRVLGTPPRYFLNASAGGFSDSVNARIDRESKSRWGPLAYVISAAAAIPDLIEHRVTFRLDGQPFEMNAYNVVVANGRFIAGGIPIAPAALLDDGEMDVVIVPALTLTQAAMAVPAIYFGKHTDSDRIILARARTVEIEADPPMGFNIDGEAVGARSMRYDMLPGALRVSVGPEAEALSDVGQHTPDELTIE